MQKNYKKRNTIMPTFHLKNGVFHVVGILMGLLLFCFTQHNTATAQVNNYAFTQTLGTYTPITGGTLLGTGPGQVDDHLFFNANGTGNDGSTGSGTGPGMPIGFPFVFNGQVFNNFAVCANGYIKLFTGSGSQTIGSGFFGVPTNYFPPLADNVFAASSSNFDNIIGGFVTDVLAQSNGTLRYQTIGTAPNRVLVVQWTNVGFWRNPSPPPAESFNFQIRLYETSNNIEVVFGTVTVGIPPLLNPYIMGVGFRGTGPSSFNLRQVTTSSNWLNSVAATANNQGGAVTPSLTPSTAPSAPGLTYRWTFIPTPSITLSTVAVPTLTSVAVTGTISPNTASGNLFVDVSEDNTFPVGNTVSAPATPATFSGASPINISGAVTGLDIGKQYFVRFRATVSTFTFTSNVQTFFTGPVVTTLDATNVTATSATINGNVLPNVACDVFFEWGTTNLLGNTTTSQSIPQGTTVQNISVNLTGLASGTLYFYRIRATFNSGNNTVTGQLKTFIFQTPFPSGQTFTNGQPASLVIGQANFTANSTTPNQSTTPSTTAAHIGSNNVFVSGSQGVGGRVLIWNPVPDVNGAPATVVVGKPTFTSTATGTTAALTSQVNGAFITNDGKLLISDTGNNRVLVWNSIPTTNGQPADVVIGQDNFTSNTPGSGRNRLNQPWGLYVSPKGQLFIGDRENNRVLVYNSIPTTNGANADLVIGQPDFNTTTPGTTASKTFLPLYCVVSNDGKLLITDRGNHRILVFNSVPTTNGAAADVVIGQTNFTTGTSGSGANKFSIPIGIALSSDGKLAVAEFANNRVLIFNSIPTVNGASADVVLGQPNFTSIAAAQTQTGMATPFQVCFDNFDRLFVSGRDMNRILVYGNKPSFTTDIAVAINSDFDCTTGDVNVKITLSNVSTNNATNITVKAALPANTIFKNTIVPSGSTYNPNTGNWLVPALPPGQSLELTYLVGTIPNTVVTVSASAFTSAQDDTNMANNSASATYNIPVFPVTISVIAPQTTTTNVPLLNIPFTLGNADLVVSASSSNTTVLPASGVVLGGSGRNRTISLTPAFNQTGISTVTITATSSICTVTRSFTFTVNPGLLFPVFDPIPLQIGEVNKRKDVNFTFTPNSLNLTNAVFTATSSNTAVVANTPGSFRVVGVGVNRTLQITPVPNALGQTTITLEVTDGSIVRGSTTFVLRIELAQPTLSELPDELIIIRNSTSPAIPFRIGDPSHLIFVDVSDPTIIPLDPANIVISGYNQDYTFTLVPAKEKVGNLTFSLIVANSTNPLAPGFNFVQKDILVRVIDVTGVEQLGRSSFQVYPNPSADGIFNITTGEALQGKMQVNVYDLKGQLIYSQTLENSGKNTLDLGHLQAGSYMLEIKNNKVRATTQIIRQ
ncbi:MAG: T9SS type A sorting domain-containing protein [Bacteroidia bacterium]|nr:T9SS type A sorting domain-containing protein [Bacteroidia bacterium]MDW8300866.1 T9SS type A sorting domain-containing protein [Bacteroidia bacterium]